MQDIVRLEDNNSPVPLAPTLEAVVEEFLLQFPKKQTTKDGYRRRLRQFISWLSQTDRLEALYSKSLAKKDIVAYKEALLAQGMEANSVASYLTAVRRWFAWLQSGLIYPDVAKDVEGPKKPKGHRREWLSPEQLRGILDEIDKSSREGLRDYALINLMARTGLRDIEVSRALVEDIQQHKGAQVLWIHGKGRDSKDEFVVLTREALEPVQDYILLRGAKKGEPLFCSLSDRNYGRALTPRSISRICKDRIRAIGLDDRKLSAHSLRHSAITLAILGGADLLQAQAMARHADPRTTQQTYIHDIQRVRTAAEKLVKF